MNLSLLSLITDMTLPNDTMLYLKKKENRECGKRGSFRLNAV